MVATKRDFITLQRRVVDSWLWDLPAAQTKVGLTLMLLANWKEGTTFSGGLVIVKRGQIMTSLDSLAGRSKVSKQTVRTALRNMEKAGFLTNQSTNRYRLITILNYDREQSLVFGDQHADQQAANTPLARNQHATGTQLTRNQQATNTDITREPVLTPASTEDSKQGIPKVSELPSRDQMLTKEICRSLADQIWNDQEELLMRLREDGIGKNTPTLGLTNPAKVELAHRISELVTGNGIDAAESACRHVLELLEAEARITKSRRYIDGAHWESRRFNKTLSLSLEDVQGMSRPPSTRGGEAQDVRFGRVEPGDYESYPEPGAKNLE
jgi:hypothetical protein